MPKFIKVGTNEKLIYFIFGAIFLYLLENSTTLNKKRINRGANVEAKHK